MVPAWLGTAALAALPLAVAGCGTDAVGVQACRQVQEARCRRAPACGVSLQPPYHTSGSDVDACIRFYNDQCLHGLTSGADPGPISVKACVDAINTDGRCSVVVSPQTVDACSWLGQSTSSGDAASSDSASSDSASEPAGDGAVDVGSD